jgi:hypothetical protein
VPPPAHERAARYAIHAGHRREYRCKQFIGKTIHRLSPSFVFPFLALWCCDFALGWETDVAVRAMRGFRLASFFFFFFVLSQEPTRCGGRLAKRRTRA